MPYITPEHRKELDGAIDALAERIVDESKKDAGDAAFAGLLNYAITRLALKVIRLRFEKIRYWIVAAVTGVFKNAGDEFYRRIGFPYEDKQIKAQGDVDLYAEFEKEIGG